MAAEKFLDSVMNRRINYMTPIWTRTFLHIVATLEKISQVVLNSEHFDYKYAIMKCPLLDL